MDPKPCAYCGAPIPEARAAHALRLGATALYCSSKHAKAASAARRTQAPSSPVKESK